MTGEPRQADNCIQSYKIEVGDNFSTLEEFRSKLLIYQRQSGSAFVMRRTRKKFFSTGCQYSRVTYVCVHNGKPLKDRAKEYKRRYADVKCGALITVCYDAAGDCLVVREVELNHTHPTSQKYPEIYSLNRRLDQSQKETVFSLMDNFHSTIELRNYVKSNFKVKLSRYDVRHLRDARTQFDRDSRINTDVLLDRGCNSFPKDDHNVLMSEKLPCSCSLTERCPHILKVTGKRSIDLGLQLVDNRCLQPGLLDTVGFVGNSVPSMLEVAHVSKGSRWSECREMLINLQEALLRQSESKFREKMDVIKGLLVELEVVSTNTEPCCESSKSTKNNTALESLRPPISSATYVQHKPAIPMGSTVLSEPLLQPSCTLHDGENALQAGVCRKRKQLLELRESYDVDVDNRCPESDMKKFCSTTVMRS